MNKTLVILCTGNSCRSQMAEAYARKFLPTTWSIYSAGIEKHGLNPMMLHVMQEDGIDMSGHCSKTTDELPKTHWDTRITVCNHAEANCPYMPAKQQIHTPFPDPPALVKGLDEEDALLIYRRVRDKIKKHFSALAQSL